MPDRTLNGDGPSRASLDGDGAGNGPRASNAFIDGPRSLWGTMPPATGRVAGLRLAVKDIFDVRGMVTGAGSPTFAESHRPATDHARSVAALLGEGARFVGKTVSDELAFSLMGMNAHFPRPVNWAAPARVTGGSSSGSVAAVGAGEADLALASDTGGSVRAPASFCGLIGLRPTHGRIALNGVVPLAHSFDTVGWFAADMAAYETIADILLDAPTSCENGSSGLRARRCDTLEGMLGAEASEEFERIARIALDAMAASCMPLDLGEEPCALYACFRVLQASEAWEAHGAFVQANGARMNPDVRARFEYGRALADCALGDALRLRSAFTSWLADELGDDGVLVLPTVPGPAPLTNAEPETLGDYREKAIHLLCLAGLAGLPQLTLPLGEVDGAPFGLSLVGPRGSDRRLLRLGATVMEAAGAKQRIAVPSAVPAQ